MIAEVLIDGDFYHTNGLMDDNVIVWVQYLADNPTPTGSQFASMCPIWSPCSRDRTR